MADTPPDAAQAIHEEGIPPAGQGSPTELVIPGPGGTHAVVGSHEPGELHESWLFDATGWVAVAMLALIGVMIWKGVFGGIGRALDGKVAKIRADLAEAEAIRTEAEQFRAEMESARDAARGEADQIRASAAREAQAILRAAQVDADERIARRAQAAEDRIVAAQRAAEADLRARAATLATEAARRVIAGDANDDLRSGLTAGAIEEVGRRL